MRTYAPCLSFARFAVPPPPPPSLPPVSLLWCKIQGFGPASDEHQVRPARRPVGGEKLRGFDDRLGGDSAGRRGLLLHQVFM